MEIGSLAAAVVALAALAVSVAVLVVMVRRDRSAAQAVPGAARTAELERRVKQLAQRIEVIETEVDAGHGSGAGVQPSGTTLRTAGVAVSHLGLVRFDAFQDTGGAQSFALALIDDDGDGVVLTSLHSRQATRLYVKSIRRGVADAPLSEEEIRAMEHAGIAPTV